MSASKKLSRYEVVREQIKGFPIGPGLYFMKGAGDNVLYIGKAKNLRSRAGSYFQAASELIKARGPKIAEMIGKVESVDFLETETEVDAMLQEARLIKDIRPAYNTGLVDDKSFPYLQISTGQAFPCVSITRKPKSKGVKLFGPFTNVKDLRAVMVVLQKIFKFRTCALDIKENDAKRRFFRPCLLYSIKQCSAPCGAKIEKGEYKKIIKDLIKFLCSKRSVVLRELKRQMAEAAGAKEYEKAGMYRDRIRLIGRLDQRGVPDENVQPEVFASEPEKALQQLQSVLGMAEPIRIIEGVDVAHISGKESVGSLVKFIDGKPFKSGYRRFRIKTVKGIDDCAMIAEVVRRRYKYALAGEELWPDLLLVDGGLGQLHAAENALRQMTESAAGGGGEGAVGTRIVALAKKEEAIYMQGGIKPLRLSGNSPARKLLQYVRDEAHRFAQHYHHLLRSRRIVNNKA